MKRLRDWLAPAAALLGVTILAGTAAAQSAERDTPKPAAIDSLLIGATIALHVDGMSCPFCAYGLEKRLKEIAAIDTLVIRVSDGLVLIRETKGETIGDDALHEAVEKAGFSLREIRRVERLDSGT